MISPTGERTKHLQTNQTIWTEATKSCDTTQFTVTCSTVALPALGHMWQHSQWKKIRGRGWHSSTAQWSPWNRNVIVRVVKQRKVTAYLNLVLILCADKRLHLEDRRSESTRCSWNTLEQWHGVSETSADKIRRLTWNTLNGSLFEKKWLKSVKSEKLHLSEGSLFSVNYHFNKSALRPNKPNINRTEGTGTWL